MASFTFPCLNFTAQRESFHKNNLRALSVFPRTSLNPLIVKSYSFEAILLSTVTSPVWLWFKHYCGKMLIHFMKWITFLQDLQSTCMVLRCILTWNNQKMPHQVTDPLLLLAGKGQVRNIWEELILWVAHSPLFGLWELLLSYTIYTSVPTQGHG